MSMSGKSDIGAQRNAAGTTRGSTHTHTHTHGEFNNPCGNSYFPQSNALIRRPADESLNPCVASSRIFRWGEHDEAEYKRRDDRVGLARFWLRRRSVGSVNPSVRFQRREICIVAGFLSRERPSTPCGFGRSRGHLQGASCIRATPEPAALVRVLASFLG